MLFRTGSAKVSLSNDVESPDICCLHIQNVYYEPTPDALYEHSGFGFFTIDECSMESQLAYIAYVNELPQIHTEKGCP